MRAEVGSERRARRGGERVELREFVLTDPRRKPSPGDPVVVVVDRSRLHLKRHAPVLHIAVWSLCRRWDRVRRPRLDEAIELFSEVELCRHDVTMPAERVPETRYSEQGHAQQLMCPAVYWQTTAILIAPTPHRYPSTSRSPASP